jgi:hypothetical protein
MQKISLCGMIIINLFLYSTVAYIDVLMVCHCIFYHLHVTKLYNSAVYTFKVLILPADGYRQIVERCSSVFGS